MGGDRTAAGDGSEDETVSGQVSTTSYGCHIAFPCCERHRIKYFQGH